MENLELYENNSESTSETLQEDFESASETSSEEGDESMIRLIIKDISFVLSIISLWAIALSCLFYLIGIIWFVIFYTLKELTKIIEGLKKKLIEKK